MRLNLASPIKSSKNQNNKKLLHLLVAEFAEEYEIVDHNNIFRQIFLKNRELNELVAHCMRSKGWQIEYYELPTPDDSKCLSWGYEINNDCEQWVAWRLANCD